MTIKRNQKGQFKKGVSPNPKGRAGKSILETSVSNSQNMPEFIKPIDSTKEKYSVKDYHVWGENNDFPIALAELNRKSPTHSGILNWKTIFISAKGFETGFEKEGVDNSDFYLWLKKCNADNESFKSVMRKVISDKNDSGNAFLELVRKKGERKKTLTVYHHDYTTCRVSKDGKRIIIYGDWLNYTLAKKEEIKTIPLYPVFGDSDENGYEHSIIHFKDYSPQFKYYGICDWIAGLDAAGIAYKTNKWNISRLDNSFSNSGALVIEGNFTPAQAKKLKDDFNKEFTGEDSQGKVMFVVKSLGGGQTTFTPTTNNSEGEWLELHKQSKEDLLNVHNWFASLSGNIVNTGFDTNRIRSEYQLALNTVIKEAQESYLDILKPILKEEAGFETENFRFWNEIPLTIQDLLDPKEVLTIDEQREIFGYNEMPNNEGKMLLVKKEVEVKNQEEKTK